MKKLGILTVLAACMVLGSLARAQSTNPPTNLKLVGDHWTPWDPPPAAPGSYTIVKGDTLWDLSERWLGDPFLWPQVWDENRYILDSHWIYPGDPLVIPGRPTVVPDDGPPAVADDPREPVDDGSGQQATALVPAPLRPVAGEADIYCSGYIDPEHEYSDVWVGGSEWSKTILGEGDVIYLSQGRNMGLQPGDEFAVVRELRQVEHPATGDVLGTYISRLGRARVMLTQETTATAVIEMSCQDIRESDELVPWEDIPIPRMSQLPDFNRYDGTPSGGPTGMIVAAKDDITDVAQGNIVQTDLGASSGVVPGQILTLYQDNDDLPRINTGQAVVLTVEPLTSTAKIMRSVRESRVGSKVEAQ